MAQWNLQQINQGGRVGGPASTGSIFASVFNEQHHIVFADDDSFTLWDAWYDEPTDSWNLQAINNGGRTNGPQVNIFDGTNFCVSTFRDQQHFAYSDSDGFIWDAWYDGPTSNWNLQQINLGGRTDSPRDYISFAGTPGTTPYVSVFGDQQHFAFADGNGTVWDAWYDGPTGNWHLQTINNGGRTNGPLAAGSPFVSVFGDQQHFAYGDANGIIWDAWYDGPANRWNLQQINMGGRTDGPPSQDRNIGTSPFISVFNDQQHFVYKDIDGTIWDAWYDGPTGNWNLQTINNGGRTNGPLAAEPPFVSVFGDQQHFAYSDENFIIWDTWYDGNTGTWNLQQINAGGRTTGPAGRGVFVSVYKDQQHFTYQPFGGGVIWDAWWG